MQVSPFHGEPVFDPRLLQVNQRPLPLAEGEVLETGKPKLLSYGIADEDAWEVGLPCGGEIDVFVEPLE